MKTEAEKATGPVSLQLAVANTLQYAVFLLLNTKQLKSLTSNLHSEFFFSISHTFWNVF